MADKSGASPFRERAVGFVDLLGFADIVKRMEVEPILYRRMRDALKKIRDTARKSTGGPAVEMTAFSDCYLISAPKGEEGAVLWRVHSLAASLLANAGILSRGAIVSGPAYHHQGVLFGPAITEAYLLANPQIRPGGNA